MVQNYQALAQVISSLFSPYVEVVLHNLKTFKIVYLSGNFSRRKIGDPSDLVPETNWDEYSDIKASYSKTNWNGRTIKSISCVLKDDKKLPEFLLCINLDISEFEKAIHFLKNWIQISHTIQPNVLFQEDWKERLHQYIHQYVQEQGWPFEKLSRNEKKQIIHHLEQLGALEEKHSTIYLAEILDLSRASIYNYLKEKKNNEPKTI